MPQNIEIEFKNMLTAEEYYRIKTAFSLSENQFFSQKNHYFDSPAFALKEKGSALRIREKNNLYEMTLKQPVDVGLLETNQEITEAEAVDALEQGSLPKGEISTMIEEMGISFSTLRHFGTLATKRAEFPYEKGLMVLDYSTYFNKEDYELEYEVDNYETGRDAFTSFLKKFDIQERKTENKIKRFFNQKYNSSLDGR